MKKPPGRGHCVLAPGFVLPSLFAENPACPSAGRGSILLRLAHPDGHCAGLAVVPGEVGNQLYAVAGNGDHAVQQLRLVLRGQRGAAGQGFVRVEVFRGNAGIVRLLRTNEAVGRRMDFSSDAKTNSEGLLPRRSEKAMPDAPPNGAGAPQYPRLTARCAIPHAPRRGRIPF